MLQSLFFSVMWDLCLFLDPSSGTSRDWAAGVPQFPYVYTIELRPGRGSGNQGFILPPEEIRPSVLETWAGFEAMVNFIQPAE